MMPTSEILHRLTYSPLADSMNTQCNVVGVEMLSDDDSYRSG